MIKKICHSILGHTCGSTDTHAIAICIHLIQKPVFEISLELCDSRQTFQHLENQGKMNERRQIRFFLVIWVFFLHFVCSNNATSTLIILRNCLSEWETVFEERKMQCFFMKSYGHMTIQSPDLLIISSVRDNIDERSPFPFLYSNEAKWE